jgi:hypothetical protein
VIDRATLSGHHTNHGEGQQIDRTTRWGCQSGAVARPKLSSVPVTSEVKYYAPDMFLFGTIGCQRVNEILHRTKHIIREIVLGYSNIFYKNINWARRQHVDNPRFKIEVTDSENRDEFSTTGKTKFILWKLSPQGSIYFDWLCGSFDWRSISDKSIHIQWALWW